MNPESTADKSKFFNIIRDVLLSEGSVSSGRVCDALVDRIWGEFKGQRLYFGKGRIRQTDPDKIWEDFNGRNHKELAKRYGVTIRRIEQIIADRSPAHQWAEVERALCILAQSGLITPAQRKQAMAAATAQPKAGKGRKKA